MHHNDDLVHETDVDTLLDLRCVTGGHVRDRPADLLLNCFLSMVKELNKCFEHALIDSSLCIFIFCSEHVAEGTKARHCDDHLLVS